MYNETSAGEKWRTACLSSIWVGCRQAGALRKHPNTVRWYYHAPVMQDLPPHAPWARNSLLIRSMQKVVAEHMKVFVGQEKIPKNADKSWNEWKRYGKQPTIKTEHTCWMSLQQLSGGLHHFTAVRAASNQPCGNTVDSWSAWNIKSEGRLVGRVARASFKARRWKLDIGWMVAISGALKKTTTNTRSLRIISRNIIAGRQASINSFLYPDPQILNSLAH